MAISVLIYIYNYTIFIHILIEFFLSFSGFILLNIGCKIILKFYLEVPKLDDYINTKFTSRAANEINKFVTNSLHLEHVKFLAFTYVNSQNSLYISHS